MVVPQCASKRGRSMIAINRTAKHGVYYSRFGE